MMFAEVTEQTNNSMKVAISIQRLRVNKTFVKSRLHKKINNSLKPCTPNLATMKCTLHLSLLLLLLTLSNAEPIPPPDHTDLVGTARWIVKFSNVSILSTHSSFLDGYPFGQNKDVADGLYNETLSAGICLFVKSFFVRYLYLSAPDVF